MTIETKYIPATPDQFAEEFHNREREEIRSNMIKTTKRAFVYWQRRWITDDEKEIARNWTRFYSYLKLEIGE